MTPGGPPLTYLPLPDGLAPATPLADGNPELAVRARAARGALEAWADYLAASQAAARDALAARWAADPDRELIEQLLRAPASSLDTGQQPSNNAPRLPPRRDPGDVFAAVEQAAVGRLAPEREHRKDVLQEVVSGILAQGAAAYAELAPIAQPWVGHGRAERPAALALKAWSHAADRCRTGLAWTDATCGVAIFRPDSCHVRGCPRCESARATRLVDRFLAAASGCPPRCKLPAHLKDGHLRPMRQPKLHTFTIPNVADDLEQLKATRTVLVQSHRRLRQRAIYRGGRCRTQGWAAKHADWLREHGRRGCLHQPPGSRVSCPGGRLHRRCGRFVHQPVTGGVAAIETTYNELAGTWNVHLHVLADAPYIPQAELADTWAAVVPAAWRQDRASLVVDVRPVHCRRHGGRCTCAEGMRSALKEVLKYVGKPTDQDSPAVPWEGGTIRTRAQDDTERLKGAGIIDPADPGRFVALVLAWHGARLVTGFGAWAKLPKELLDDETVFLGDHTDPFGGWKLPRWCPHCGHEANWSQPQVVSRLEAFRWLRDDGGRPPPLSWMPTPALVDLPLQ